ncbi:MAG: trigger factor [Thermodesulfovibrionales bacterium]
MLKAREDVSATRKRLTIEIPADALETEIRRGLQEAQRQAKIPGFRPGKAPMTLIEKKFGRNVEADVLEKLVPHYYSDALKEAGMKPVSKPVMEEQFDFRRNESLTMTITVDVMPSVENLTYEGVKVKDVPVEVKEDEVEKALKTVAGERAAYESSEEPAETGDLVTIDYTVQGEEQGATDAVLKMGSGPYPPDFFEGLTGKKKGDAVEIETAFPEEMQSPFAGKTPRFSITIKEVKKRRLPAIDDELAKDLGFESLEQLRSKVHENMLSAKSKSADMAKQREILDTLLESHTVEVPESMLQAEISLLINDIRSGGTETRSDEELRAELEPHAVKSARASLLLEIIGEKEGVVVSDDEVKAEVLNLAQRYYISPENVIKYYITKDGSLEGVRHALFEKKVLDLLLSKATMEKGE